MGLLLLLLAATIAFAQEPPTAFNDAGSAASARLPRSGNEPARIEIDQKAGVIRFVIDGQERAVLDAAGLHVNGNIEFTGQTEDIGEWSNREAANAP